MGYDIQGGYWTQCASMPDAATARTGASGFAIGEKGYITLGQDNSSNYLADTWEYDPATDTWTQKDDYKGGARISAIAFGIGQYGYVGTGYNGNYQKDFYRFDPQAAAGQQWEIVNGFGGQKRQGGTSFVIDDKAYICCGVNNGSYVMISGASILQREFLLNCGILLIRVMMIMMMITLLLSGLMLSVL